MDMLVGIFKNTYTTKIDNHIVEIELNNCKDYYKFIKIYYNYSNNMSSTELYYIDKDKMLYGACITEKKKKLIINKIKKAIEIHKKFIV